MIFAVMNAIFAILKILILHPSAIYDIYHISFIYIAAVLFHSQETRY